LRDPALSSSRHRKRRFLRLTSLMRTQGRVIVCCYFLIFRFLLFVSCGNKPTGRARISPASSGLPVVRSLPQLPSRPLSPKLKEMRGQAMEAAAKLRELSFTGDVGMAELSAWEYGTRASEMAHLLGGDDLRVLSRLAAAGGVLPEGTDLASLAGSFTAISAGATYSPLDKQVLIVDKLRDHSLLTHEFTHALQDQHFDLMKLLFARPYNFDRAESLFAVIEGDAMNVQRRMEQGEAYGRRPLEDIQKQERDRFAGYLKEVGAFFPPLLTESFIFRYRDGARFVEGVRRARGQSGVDALFERPPVSTEQILHPEKYEANEQPRDVQVDDAVFGANGWESVTSTALGEVGVRGLLMAGVLEKEATRAATGWGGDRAYLFERPGGTPLFVWKTVWDRPVEAQEFFDAYNSLRRSTGAQIGEYSATGDVAYAVWRESGRTTILRRSGDTVIVIRGAEADVRTALEWAQR